MLMVLGNNCQLVVGQKLVQINEKVKVNEVFAVKKFQTVSKIVDGYNL